MSARNTILGAILWYGEVIFSTIAVVSVASLVLLVVSDSIAVLEVLILEFAAVDTLEGSARGDV